MPDFQVKRALKKLIKHFTETPKALFLTDSAGAFTTAFFLFIIAQHFNTYFGIPTKELTYLSVIAVFFCLYSAVCFFFLQGELTPFIRFIGMANLLYCALTIGLLINHYPSLTMNGAAYFLTETVIICGLSYVELHVAAGNKEQ
ncbi:hypothetical protein [Runella slithyformis]|uniref:Uncharacterized protein n=1 Tax=Runella slithyformis (strain ATCC 29530 / DSM 19594 / LMG 11500 / NCIMB 11436 / LSU 4) TaxID=761193 RepID=A0A7U4E714_RUNSL|nr:hypothetical protein [Runella slithyformis]AEI50186.1 hypothetical protein Runsl_3828 [Runella slithyformis DSM 19594]